MLIDQHFPKDEIKVFRISLDPEYQRKLEKIKLVTGKGFKETIQNLIDSYLKELKTEKKD